MKRSMIALLLLIGSGVSASPAASNPDTALSGVPSISPDPISTAFLKVQADLTALAAAQADVARLAQAQEKARVAAKSLADDQAALNQAIQAAANPPPTPVVPPAATHVIEVLEIGATSCGPCNAMDAILKTLVAEGMSIKRINTDQNPALVDRWQIKGTPTFVMLVDAKEVSRSIGALDIGQLRGWYKATQDWSRKLKGESP